MGNSYIQSVEKKLKKQGLSDAQIMVEINKINNPNIMEEIENVDEVNMPIVEEEEVVVEEEVVTDEEEVAVDTEEEVA